MTSVDWDSIFSNITGDWAVSIIDCMKMIVHYIIVVPFKFLAHIPMGFGDSSVLDFIIGMFIVSVAVFFFWRSASDGISFSNKKEDDVKTSASTSPHKNVSDYSTNKPRGVWQ